MEPDKRILRGSILTVFYSVINKQKISVNLVDTVYRPSKCNTPNRREFVQLCHHTGRIIEGTVF